MRTERYFLINYTIHYSSFNVVLTQALITEEIYPNCGATHSLLRGLYPDVSERITYVISEVKNGDDFKSYYRQIISL